MTDATGLNSSPNEKTGLDSASIKERVKQIRYSYLDTEYAVDYYKELNANTARYARHFDFAIGLGAVTSGGSGLGILGDPRFAWLCGILTTASLILTVAKTTYDWSGKSKFALEMVEFYGKLSQKYQLLIDDLNFSRRWDDSFNSRYVGLRTEQMSARTDGYPPLSQTVTKKIQDQIKARIDYRQWWSP